MIDFPTSLEIDLARDPTVQGHSRVDAKLQRDVRAFPLRSAEKRATREPACSVPVSRRFYSVLRAAGGSPLCSPRPSSRERASRSEETRRVPRGDNTRRNRGGEWAANEINAGMFCACLCISAFFPLFSSQGVFSEQQVRGVRGLSARYDRQRLGLEEQC